MNKAYHQAVHQFLAHPHTCAEYSKTGKFYCCAQQMKNWQELIRQHDEYLEEQEDVIEVEVVGGEFSDLDIVVLKNVASRFGFVEMLYDGKMIMVDVKSYLDSIADRILPMLPVEPEGIADDGRG